MLPAVAFMAGCLTIAAPVEGRSSGSLHLEKCPVALLRDIQLSSDEAGQIVEMSVKPETILNQGDVVAQIDDRQVIVQKAAALAAFNAAKEEANNLINEEFAKASWEQAKAELRMSKDADRSYPGAVVPAEIQKLELAAKRAELQIKQAKIEHTVAGHTAAQKKADLDAAELSFVRRKLLAPFGGVVAEIKKKQHEWVREGDPVVRLIQMDRVKVQGFYEVNRLLPQEVRGCPVVVAAQLGERTMEFTGVVTEISTNVRSNKCNFYAEVENRLENNEWLLREGILVTMTVDLSGKQ